MQYINYNIVRPNAEKPSVYFVKVVTVKETHKK